jgi:iron complex transport system substrate-binding protein
VQDRVYVADANSYFARPGPRLVDGAELLSHLIVGSPWNGPADAYRKVNLLT